MSGEYNLHQPTTVHDRRDVPALRERTGQKTREIEGQPEEQKQGKSAPTVATGGVAAAAEMCYHLKNTTIYVPMNTVWIKLRAGAVGPLRRSGSTPTGAAGPTLAESGAAGKGYGQAHPAVQQIRNVLMTTHKGIEDFTFRTQEDWAENIANSFAIRAQRRNDCWHQPPRRWHRNYEYHAGQHLRTR